MYISLVLTAVNIRFPGTTSWFREVLLELETFQISTILKIFLVWASSWKFVSLYDWLILCLARLVTKYIQVYQDSSRVEFFVLLAALTPRSLQCLFCPVLFRKPKEL